jgi:hypothetical protein
MARAWIVVLPAAVLLLGSASAQAPVARRYTGADGKVRVALAPSDSRLAAYADGCRLETGCIVAQLMS